MNDLSSMASTVGGLLKARGQTVAVAESSAGGLISAALLAVPGASAYFLGGSVIYTQAARRALLRVPDEAMAGMRSSSEPYALLKARSVRELLGTTWGLSERPGLLVLPAIVTVMRPGTRASPWRAPSSGSSRSRPASPIGRPTCGDSHARRSRSSKAASLAAGSPELTPRAG